MSWELVAQIAVLAVVFGIVAAALIDKVGEAAQWWKEPRR